MSIDICHETLPAVSYPLCAVLSLLADSGDGSSPYYVCLRLKCFQGQLSYIGRDLVYVLKPCSFRICHFQLSPM